MLSSLMTTVSVRQFTGVYNINQFSVTGVSLEAAVLRAEH